MRTGPKHQGRRTAVEHYAGIDVSLELSSVCIVDTKGKIVREAKIASDPDALIAFFKRLGFPVARIGLEPGRCRNGFTPGWRKPVSRRFFWRPDT